MSAPSEKTVKRLFALSRNQCAFPQCENQIVHQTGTVIGDICHINAHSKGGPRFDPKQSEEQRHSFENLVLFCSVHHRIVDSNPKKFSADLLREIKEMHERTGDCELSREAAEKARRLFEHAQITVRAEERAQVMIASPGAIQAQQVIIKNTRRRAPSIIPTEGAIGHHLAKRNYILHLIERYNEYQNWDSSKHGKGKFITIFNAVKKNFGSKWDLVPEHRFPELASFLQRRILNSKLGRIRNSRGQKCFSSWEEWLDRHHSQA